VAVGVCVAVAVGVGEGVAVAVAVPNMATVGGRFRAVTVIRPTSNAIALATVKRRRLLAKPGPCRFFIIKPISYEPTEKYGEGEYARPFETPWEVLPLRRSQVLDFARLLSPGKALLHPAMGVRQVNTDLAVYGAAQLKQAALILAIWAHGPN
jgi:hypothetical protein